MFRYPHLELRLTSQLRPGVSTAYSDCPTMASPSTPFSPPPSPPRVLTLGVELQMALFDDATASSVVKVIKQAGFDVIDVDAKKTDPAGSSTADVPAKEIDPASLWRVK